MTIPASPDFRSPTFLRGYIQLGDGFYNGRAVDEAAACALLLFDDGTVFDKHAPSGRNATRFVLTHAMLFSLRAKRATEPGVRHAVDFLRNVFRDRSPAATPGCSTGTENRRAFSMTHATATAMCIVCSPMRTR